MGYDLTITRRSDLYETEGGYISEEEWYAFVQQHPSLNLSSSDPNFVVWSEAGHETDHWLFWADGMMDSKNPDHFFIEKMTSIAPALSAKVLGEENEEYSQQTYGYQVRGERGTIQYHRRTAPRDKLPNEEMAFDPSALLNNNPMTRRSDYDTLEYSSDGVVTMQYYQSANPIKSDYEAIDIIDKHEETKAECIKREALVADLATRLTAAKNADLETARRNRQWWRFW